MKYARLPWANSNISQYLLRCSFVGDPLNGAIFWQMQTQAPSGLLIWLTSELTILFSLLLLFTTNYFSPTLYTETISLVPVSWSVFIRRVPRGYIYFSGISSMRNLCRSFPGRTATLMITPLNPLSFVRLGLWVHVLVQSSPLCWRLGPYASEGQLVIKWCLNHSLASR